MTALQGKVVGFRFWTLDGHRLRSPGGIWEVGVNQAECKRDLYESVPLVAHTAPAHTCTCGLYAWYSQEWSNYVMGSMLRPDGYVGGAVLAWGQIEVHHSGFRAQYAEPVLLSYSGGEPYDHVTRVQAIASEMGLPCVPVEELEARALKLGDPIPEELRPEPASYALPSTALSIHLGWGGSSVGAVRMAPVATSAGFATARGGYLVMASAPAPVPRRRLFRFSPRYWTLWSASNVAINGALGIVTGSPVSWSFAGAWAIAGALSARAWRRQRRAQCP